MKLTATEVLSRQKVRDVQIMDQLRAIDEFNMAVVDKAFNAIARRSLMIFLTIKLRSILNKKRGQNENN